MTLTESKILVFIVAYHAEKHIRSVLDRVPKEVVESSSVHFLLIDDASKDSSAQYAADWAKEKGYNNFTILRNPVNQGYGGNQKIGYRFAIDHDFDQVILLHGDGQYAPELLPEFIQLFDQSGADVILGSRMHSVASARKGGMPVYKIVGNRVLTICQNFLTGNSLSEYHTGYRAYSTEFLKSVPFEINTNEFHFDTEILLQAFGYNAIVRELNIPTFYGDEICRVDGMKYAKDVMVATVQYKMTTLGMFCSLKYIDASQSVHEHKSDQQYSAHAEAIRLLKKRAPLTLLDIGNGSGFAAQQCQSAGALVTTQRVNTAEDDRPALDLERQDLPFDIYAYDAVLLMDVLEQLWNPEQFLLKMRNETSSKVTTAVPPLVVISTPNVAFFTMRLGLILGRFNYANRGILEINHRRLFTAASLKQMLIDCNYEIVDWKAVGPPFELVIPNQFGKVLSNIANKFARLRPSLFGFQFVVSCKPKPGVKQLLAESEKFRVAQGHFEN